MKNRRKVKMIRKLMVWKKARELAIGSNRLRLLTVDGLPSVSPSVGRTIATVTAAITEAFETPYTREKLRHLRCAQQALRQYQYYLELAQKKEGWRTAKFRIEADRVAVMVNAHIEVLKK